MSTNQYVPDPEIAQGDMLVLKWKHAQAQEYLDQGQIRKYWATIFDIRELLKPYCEPTYWNTQMPKKWPEAAQKK